MSLCHAGPFERIVSYNLGLFHLATGQYASAFHHFSSSINIKSDFAHTYMYLAVALAKLDDVDNASAAYEKAIELDDDMMFRLNYGEWSYLPLGKLENFRASMKPKIVSPTYWVACLMPSTSITDIDH